MTDVGRWILGGAVAAAVTKSTRLVLGATPPGGSDRWTRRNHRGEPISLLAGPAVAGGLLVGASVSAGSCRVRAAHLLATGGAALFGTVDDLAEDTSARSKGLRGHLAAAASGKLTTGGLKVLGIGLSSVLAATAVPADASWPRRGVDVLADGALIAASANMLNLLDLRPGRALKTAGCAATALAVTGSGAVTGAILGTVAAAAPGDLAEQDMLGDSGANALGALLGSVVVTSASRPVRRLVLAGLVGLTLASERVSFSKVIASTPWLNAIDMWGRRPVAANTASSNHVEPAASALADAVAEDSTA